VVSVVTISQASLAMSFRCGGKFTVESYHKRICQNLAIFAKDAAKVKSFNCSLAMSSEHGSILICRN